MTKPKKTPESKDKAVAIISPELSNFIPDNINNLTILERNYLIMHLYVIRNVQQTDIATMFGLSQSNISMIISDLKNDEHINNKLIPVWQKDISMECRRKATALIDQIDPANHPKSKLVMDGAILIDKSRELSGKPDITIAVLTSDLRSVDQEIADLNRQLGVYE